MQVHIMFPQPWYYGTKGFPHPMAGLKYVAGRKMNEQSYKVFEALTWTSFGREINHWRTRTLGLPRLYAASSSSNFVQAANIPFSAMWSPAFVPKPDDWPEQCEVVGTFVLDQKKDFDVSPFAELSKWLKAGPKPIFIGFGSMVIKDTKSLEYIITSAAHAANVRVVVQSSWSKLNCEDRSDLLRNVGPCPHDWLLPLCRAVVHHGGAGTTAAGLRFGLPTMVCPFFADQFMWGFFVEQAGVGPKACPVNELTVEKLTESFLLLSSEELRDKAHALSDYMAHEDGIQGGVDHFLTSIPKDSMLCDVGTLIGESKLARYRIVGAGVSKDGIKVSPEIAAMVESSFEWKRLWRFVPSFNKERDRYWHAAAMRRHPFTMYNLTGVVETVPHGCMAGLFGLLRHTIFAPFQAFVLSDRLARSSGALGCLFGLVASAFVIIGDVFRGVLIFFDRILTGITNGCCGQQNTHVIFPGWEARVHDTNLISGEKASYARQGITRARKAELQAALDLVVNARKVFESADPFFPETHQHYVVVPLDTLISSLQSPRCKSLLNLSGRELEIVTLRLKRLETAPPEIVRRSDEPGRLRKLRSHANFLRLLTSVREVDSSREEDSTRWSSNNGSSPGLDLDDGSSAFNASSEQLLILTEENDEDSEFARTTEVSFHSSTKDEQPAKPPLRHVHSRPRGLGHCDGIVKCIVLNALNPQTWKKQPGETVVSFSVFLQSLNAVCAEKCLSEGRSVRSPRNRTRTASEDHVKSAMSMQSDFSEYLN